MIKPKQLLIQAITKEAEKSGMTYNQVINPERGGIIKAYNVLANVTCISPLFSPAAMEDWLGIDRSRVYQR